MRSNHLSVQPLAGYCGAEVHGVDISQDLGDDTIGEIRQALLDHGVIFFRDQTLDRRQHKRFARRFGELFVQPNYRGTGEDDEVLEIRRAPTDKRIVGENWHADTTMTAEPPMGAILYGVEVPPYGGDTLFSSLAAAYDALSDGMKSMLNGLRAIHSDYRIAGPRVNMNASRSTKMRQDETWQPTVNIHPVVRIHPETGRKGLFVNRSHVDQFEGMTVEESKPILDFLFRHTERPEFTCRFRWANGSVAFWDNRAVHHMAVHDAGPFFRHVRRVQIAGDRPY
ncbi:MAG: TauD/TfdA dioxygenase family protein [Acetobacteraceae bacterium]